jgi:aspartyl-tRNA(Asn)/glutamyl-tRNA(Gln) amidotransferase subunit A
MTTDLALLPAAELLAGYRDRRFSPVEAIDAVLARIERLEPRLNAFRQVDAEGARAAAKASEARWRQGAPSGLLDGVPTTVKDLVITKGWPTLRGSRAIAPDQPWTEDAPAVARLREAGAILIGKTTTPEFGWKGVTDSPLTGITRNPWNLERTPGGSSGGASAAAAAGLGALHIGTDGGGSIRIPASFTGIFGLKPTFGRVPAFPASPFGTLAHLGPMTRTVTDAALMLSVMARPDPRDWYALPPGPADYRDGLEDGVRGLRIAYAPTIAGAPVEPAVAEAVAAAARIFAELGATVEEADPGLPDSAETFRRHWYPGAAAVLQAYAPAQRAQMDPGFVEIAGEGAAIGLLDYLAAVKQREALGLAMNQFHQRWDLLLLPTMPLTAFAAGREVPAGSTARRWTEWTPFTYPFNLTRQPAASLPCGLAPDGLPIGLQIVGPLYADALVLRAARAYERARPFALPPEA